jgi:hypothetical protein
LSRTGGASVTSSWGSRAKKRHSRTFCTRKARSCARPKRSWPRKKRRRAEKNGGAAVHTQLAHLPPTYPLTCYLLTPLRKKKSSQKTKNPHKQHKKSRFRQRRRGAQRTGGNTRAGSITRTDAARRSAFRFRKKDDGRGDERQAGRLPDAVRTKIGGADPALPQRPGDDKRLAGAGAVAAATSMDPGADRDAPPVKRQRGEAGGGEKKGRKEEKGEGKKKKKKEQRKVPSRLIYFLSASRCFLFAAPLSFFASLRLVILSFLYLFSRVFFYTLYPCVPSSADLPDAFA